MDNPNISMPLHGSYQMFVTSDGSTLTPSLVNYESERPIPLDQLRGDWFAEKVLASNTGDAQASRADPVVLRDGDRGRIAIAHQTPFEDEPIGEVAAEIIINYLFTEAAEETFPETTTVPLTETTYSEVTISEIMYGSEREYTPPQWIEISNAGSEPVDMTGWKLTVQNINSVDLSGPVNGTIVFQDEHWGDAPWLWPNDTLIIVVDEDSNNSGGFRDVQIFALHRRGGLGIGYWQTFLSAEGFSLKLTDSNGNLVDEAGNYDGTTTHWNLPYYYNRGRIRAGNRTSLVRVYENGVALAGTNKESWVSAADASLIEVQKTFYGDENDISSVGILGPNTAVQIPAEPPMVEEPSKPITISEIMYGSESSFTPTQWIEIYNNGSEPVNMTGWKLVVKNMDRAYLDGPLDATIVFEDDYYGDAPRLWANDFLLIVVEKVVNSGGFTDDQIFALYRRGGLGISYSDTFMSGNGFLIQLIDKDGNVVDQAGNYDGSQKTWDLPYYYNRGRTRDGNRSSLIRLYDDGDALDGTLENSWIYAADAELSEDQLTYYGDENDISSVGIGIIDFGAPVFLKEDVNRDGVVNILDLVSVANDFGQSGEKKTDINGDNIVNILDLVRVAGAFGKTPSAPALRAQALSTLTAADVRLWLSQAESLTLTDTTSLQGILFLEQLLAALTPKETVLLANYPNPFNPETWIPYHLAKDAKVSLHIYTMNGTLVRTLALGHQAAGMYQNRFRAAYWDGKNEFGESVASGVYFYTFTAGEFSATRKMLIQK